MKSAVRKIIKKQVLPFLLSSFYALPALANASQLPSVENKCAEVFLQKPSLFVKNQDAQYAQKLLNDPLAKVESSMLTAREGEKSPINLAKRMMQFREKYLGYLKSTAYREPLIRSFEASLRMRSKLVGMGLRQNENYGQYDLVIVGAGVHGIISLHRVLAENPTLKVLLVDEGDTAGAVFRYGKEAFNINSSNRASGDGARPLPGEGNINELPGLPIQVSDLTAVKYPTANELGVPLVAALYAAVREYPNVDVLMNTKANQILAKPKDGRFSESISIGSKSNQNIQIDSQKIILATGLGEPNIPAKLKETLGNSKELIQSSSLSAPPRVLTFEDMIRIIGMSNDPMSIFKGKKIGVVGKGDSSNVFIEFLLGYASREAYAQSSAQEGRPEKIFWIGQDKVTCKDFISDVRSRYQGISTGFKSSNPNLEAIIQASPGKISDVTVKSGNRVNAILDNGQSVENLDYIILNTGFSPNVRSLFQQITNANSTKFNSDVEFFENKVNPFELLESPTVVSPQKTKVGLQYEGRQIYILGTAGYLFSKESAQKAPVGIVQNFVGIFNYAPRVIAATKLLLSNFQPLAQKSELRSAVITSGSDRQQFSILNIQEVRFLSDKTIPYLQSTFKEALSYTAISEIEPIQLLVNLEQNGTLRISSNTKVDVTNLIQLLAQSREFFSLAKEFLKFVPGKSLLFSENEYNQKGRLINYDLNQANVSIVETPSRIGSNNPIIQVVNKSVELRGLRLETSKESVTQKIEEEISPELKEVKEKVLEKGFDVNKPDVKTGKTILMEAIEENQVDVVKFLLSLPEIDINVTTPGTGKNSPNSRNTQKSAIFYAVESEKFELTQLLLQQPKINLNIFYDLSKNLLIAAAIKGNLEMVKLLTPFFDINRATGYGGNNYGGTALLFAARKGHKDIVQFFMKQPDFDVNAGGNFDFALEESNFELLKLFLTRKDLDLSKNKNVLSMALSLDNKGIYSSDAKEIEKYSRNIREVIEELVKRTDVDVNTGNPLITAAATGNARVVEALLKNKNVDVNAGNSEVNGTAFAASLIGRGNIKVMELLLARPELIVTGYDLIRTIAFRGSMLEKVLENPTAAAALKTKTKISDGRSLTPLEYAKSEFPNAPEKIKEIEEIIEKAQQRKSGDKEKKVKKESNPEFAAINSAKKAIFNEIKPGKFMMGPEGSEKVKTIISKPFFMMSTQVTQMMWARLKIAMGEVNPEKINPSYFKTGPDSVRVLAVQMKPDHPVERVSYNDAVEFVSALNELSMKDDNKIQELLKDIIPDHRLGDKYDLPTEAQWEFVKRNRGNAKGLYFDRDDSSEMSLYAWWKENSGNQTHAVASLQPRMIDGMPFYDMEGNVWEKTKDTIRLGEPLLGGVDPLDTSGYWITFRGAAYNAYESLLQAGYRGDSSSRDGRLDSSGIRLVRTRE